MLAAGSEEASKEPWFIETQILRPARIVPPKIMLRTTVLLCLILVIDSSPLKQSRIYSLRRNY